MRGAIAAGHPATAAAGARVLEEGGNAVDACVAAGFASWVAESPLTGPGGGGFMLVHHAGDGATRLADFFVSVPSGRPLAEMETVDVDFSGGASQLFRIGAASVAVPGTTAGLEAVHTRYGSLPWAELVRPAIELAQEGVELTAPQAYLHAILDLILRHTDEGRKVYGRRGRRLAGERIVFSDLADTLETIARQGAAAVHGGPVAKAIAASADGVTVRDLSDFRVIWRRPVRAAFCGHEFRSNPPPSSGGVLIGYGLRLLDDGARKGGPGTAEAIARMVEVMRAQARARDGSFARDLYRGGLVGRLIGPVDAPSMTTHISVVDARGNAAALTVSTGSGSGVIVPGTGIHLNNMLGEYDLVGPVRPGMRLTSMMAPSVVLAPGGLPRLVVGSAGSLRLRGAIMQIVVNVVQHDLDVQAAIEAPRIHFDEPHVHAEGGADAAELDRLEAKGYDVTRWRRRNLFFGGASAVERRADGTLAAAGDPRRGGAGVVVE